MYIIYVYYPPPLTQDPLLAVEQVRQVAVDVLIFGDVFMDAHTLFAAMLRMAPAQVCQIIPSQIILWV